jgi:hypothetical protein
MNFFIFRFIVVLFIYVSVYAGVSEMPTVFIGTYSGSNQDTIKNLVEPNIQSNSKKDWGLSSFTEKLFETDLKDKLGENKVNLVLKKDFEKRLKYIVENTSIDISDKKIGFLDVDTFQNVDQLETGKDLISITINLIFAQIGKESNRGEDNNFEVRYTNGITVTGMVEVSRSDKRREEILHNAYRTYYKKALGHLMDLMIADKNSKQVSSFNSDDIYFVIDRVIIGKKAKKLALQIYGDEDIAKKQTMMMLQEKLIESIRGNKTLDDVVLLYPSLLNETILNNWKDYLSRINEVEGFEDTDSDISLRKIEQACNHNNMNPAIVSIDGYMIEVLISELYNKTVEKDDIDSANVLKSSLVARVVIGLEGKKSIDGLSIPSHVIKKKKMCLSQEVEGYNLENTFSNVRKDKVVKILRKSIENLSPKLLKLIEAIVKQRKKELSFEYSKFCEE